MDVWKEYEGKKVFVILKNQRKYSGLCVGVAEAGKHPETNINYFFITIKDIYDHYVTFLNSEIEVIQDEK